MAYGRYTPYQYDGGASSYETGFNEDEFYNNWYADDEDAEAPTREDLAAARERYVERMREQEGRFRSVAMVYEKADRILTMDPVNVTIVNDANMPAAWSDGQTISLNVNILQNYDDRDIVSLHGVNYHEVCHILYSPRAGSEMGKWVMEKGYFNAFNCLEDQRIETLFAGRYPSTRVFLEAEALRYVVAKSVDNQVHALIHGRRFLNKSLRVEAYRRFAHAHGENTAKAVADIIDEYRTLALPKESARAKELIERFELILRRMNLNPPHPCSNREPAKKGRPEPASQQAKDAEASSQVGEPVTSDDVKKKSDGGDTNDDKSATKDQDPGQENGDQNGTETEAPSAEEQAQSREDNRKFADMVNDMIDQLADSHEARREVKEFRKAVRMNDLINNRIRKQDFGDGSIHNHARVAANKFGETLRLIEEEADPTWEYEVASGKLNTNRAMHADVNDLNTLFDRWYEGDDATVIEAAILLDRSGSMAYRINDASEAMWVIKRGLERIDARCTVYTFHDNSRLLYSADERADANKYRTVAPGGCTNPLRALEETELIMAASNRPTKIVFMVTDGYWDYEDKNNEVIARMNADGVLTVMVFIGSLDHYKIEAKNGNQHAANELKRLSHGAKVMRAIADVNDLAPLAQNIVTAHLNAKIRR